MATTVNEQSEDLLQYVTRCVNAGDQPAQVIQRLLNIYSEELPTLAIQTPAAEAAPGQPSAPSPPGDADPVEHTGSRPPVWLGPSARWEVPQPDLVNHPPHYTSHPSGVECIEVVEHMGFNVGNAVKYLWRAGLKHDELEDLRKARWYVEREIAKRENTPS